MTLKEKKFFQKNKKDANEEVVEQLFVDDGFNRLQEKHTNLSMAWIDYRKAYDLTMKRGKIVKNEGIKLPDGEVMKQVGQEGYTYLGIIELDKIKETEMKKKINKECKQRQRLI